MKNLRRAFDHQKREKGFTLTELIFICGLLPLVFISLYGVLYGANQIFRMNDVYSYENDAAMQILRTMSRELSQTSSVVSPSHLTISNTGLGGSTILTFQIPVDYDADGDVINTASNPRLEWGAYDFPGQTTGGTLNAWIRYTLVASTNPSEGNQLVRQVLTNGLGGVAGSQKVLISNVLSFTVSQSSSVLTPTLTVRKQEPITGRNMSATFSHSVVTRNNVT